METAEQASDLARLHVFVWREGIRSAPQLLSHVAVRETSSAWSGPANFKKASSISFSLVAGEPALSTRGVHDN
jgi:hypothetical protein